MTSYLRTPGQASTNFALGSFGAARPKGLFFVRFRRPAPTGSGDGTVSSSPQDIAAGTEFGFVVKSLDQPKISLKTEEVSQYNKKRQVHTGFEVQPVTITLFDTMSGTARDLWHDYLRYHFGDFNHPTELDWQPDQLVPTMYGNDIGYGLTLPPDGNNEADRYYFQTIEIIQVYGGFFTKMVLVNPRILSCDPDELDYERMEPTTYRMQITYETVLFSEMDRIQNDAELMSLFGDPRLEGSVLDITDGAAPPSDWAAAGTVSPFDLNTVLGPLIGGQPINIADVVSGLFSSGIVPNVTSGTGGVLGGFSFGNIATSAVERLATGKTGSFASDLVYSATNSSALSSIVGMVAAKANTVQAGSGPTAKSFSANPVVYDTARAIVTTPGNNNAPGITKDVVTGLVTTSLATGDSPREHASRTGGALNVSDTALAIANAARSPTSQIGVRRR